MKSATYLGLTFFLACGPATAATFHVAPNGSGTACTPSNPCSLNRANKQATAGDTVYLKGGNYRFQYIEPANSGKDDNYITYRSTPGDLAVLDYGIRIDGWEKQSGTDGRDAVYRAPVSRNHRIIWHGTVEEVGRDTGLWNRSIFDTNKRDICKCIEQEGEFYIDGGFAYARVQGSVDPDILGAIGSSNTQAIKVDNRSYIRIRDIRVQYPRRHVQVENADHLEFINNEFWYGRGGLATFELRSTSYSVVRGNDFKSNGSINAHKGDTAGMSDDSHHNIWENNRFEWNAHAAWDAVGSGIHHNVFRYNDFGNSFGTGQSWSKDSHDNLTEHNKFHEFPQASQLKRQHPSDHNSNALKGDRNISRFNELWDGSVAYAVSERGNSTSSDSKIYHNTIVGNVSESRNGPCILFSRLQTRSVRFVNNICSENLRVFEDGSVEYSALFAGFGLRYDQPEFARLRPTIDNNLWYTSGRPSELFGGVDDVAQARRRWPQFVRNNVQAGPQFVRVDVEDPDFRLRAGSPAIDAGRCLTRTTAAGSSTRDVPVGDGTFFVDGWGIIEPDEIQVGSNRAISLAEGGSGTLSLESPISYKEGACVSLPYAGSAPDIGAHEFPGKFELVPPNNLRLSVQ